MARIDKTRLQYQNVEASQWEFKTVFQENEPITAAARMADYSMVEVSPIHALLPLFEGLAAILTY